MMNWGLVSVVLAVVFFMTTIILSVKLSKRKKLSWAFQTTKVIGLGTDAPPEIKLMFNKRQVTDVYQTILIFFNSGNQTIRKNDVTEVITVDFEDTKILRPPIIRANSKEQIKFTVNESTKTHNGSVELDFLYLDHNDGAVIEILHTESKNITCSGNIIGIKKISRIEDYRPYRRSFKKIWSFREFIAPVTILVLFGLLMLTRIIARDEPIAVVWDEWGIVFSLLLGMIVGISLGKLMLYLSPFTSPFPKWCVIGQH